MNKPMKAALMSAFVFPGLGHIFLKRYGAGAVLAGSAFAALYVITTSTLHRAMAVVDKIQGGEMQPDISAISELLSSQASGADARLANLATTLFIIIWLIAIVHSYRAGLSRGGGSIAVGQSKT